MTNYPHVLLIQSWRWKILAAVLLMMRAGSLGVNTDGILLLSFKFSILSDPDGVLKNWNYHDATPCSWNGVVCGTPGSADAFFRVTGLTLQGFGLVGSIPATLGMIEHLTNLNLANNSINGSIPEALFGASKLQNFDFSNNFISGQISEHVGRLRDLRVFNLSDNALVGKLPANLTALPNLTHVSLKNNYLSGSLPGGFDSVRFLDLSSNLMNGSLPPDFGGANLEYLNVSFNRLSGEIPLQFADNIAANATMDLSFNNLTGPIPGTNLFFSQETMSFSGNPGLCGRPLRNLCPIPSSAAALPDAQSQDSPPAIAAIPKTISSNPATVDGGSTAGTPAEGKRSGLQTGTILGIVAGDIAGIGILVLVFVYVYHAKKRKAINAASKKEAESPIPFDWASSASSEEYSWLGTWTCLQKQRHGAADDGQNSSASATSDSEDTENFGKNRENAAAQEHKTGALVTVDGEKDLELEILLKASAYILGASGSSIMYKAVLDDGTALAVRRIGESGLERFRDFENQVRSIAKLAHPNLVRIRGFYWGSEEKLVIYDFVPNGSLANARYRKAGSSPCHLPWEARLKIAKGVARGLAYIHDKKHVHGNLKPTNILLGPDMEPKIGDFGLERLVVGGDNSSKACGSARNFGSKRSTASRESFQEFSFGQTPSPSPSVIGVSPYLAPESLRSLKPNPKWDIFSFGTIMLELLTGKVIMSDEASSALVIGATASTEEDKGKVLRMADAAIRGHVEGKEEGFLALLKLGYLCISHVPQKRPSMKEVLQGLEKFECSMPASQYHGL